MLVARRCEIWLVAAFVLVLFCGCKTQSQRVEETKQVRNGAEWVSIATINDYAEEMPIVYQSLSEVGIQCAIWGSVVWSVDVPKADWVRAIQKLKQEPKLKGKWIRFT